MRMPFIEFITNGDLKFIIVYIIFSSLAVYHFVKKQKIKCNPENEQLITYHNSHINNAAFWILISGVLSLFLGLMHSFYFIGKVGGIAPKLIFQGISNALITPVLGISLFIILKILKGNFNPKTSQTQTIKNTIKFLLLFFVSQVSFSQANSPSGDSLRQEGRLDKAILEYKRVYKKFPDNKKNVYNLACAYALTFQKDSAYHYLNLALKNDTSLWALADTDLYALTDDLRWKEIENRQLQKYQAKNGELKQPEYAKKLLEIIIKDQVFDYYIELAKTFYMKKGYIPQWYYPLGYLKQKIGADNFKTLQKLIMEYGWPKYSTVGKLASDAPLLVINHHESDSIRKKYLPQIRKSCFSGEGSCIEYAKIQDRILVNENKPQIYGMQFRYNAERKLEPFPIIEPEYVDKRRKEIGLEPLKTYLKRKINFDWVVVQKN